MHTLCTTAGRKRWEQLDRAGEELRVTRECEVDQRVEHASISTARSHIKPLKWSANITQTTSFVYDMNLLRVT